MKFKRYKPAIDKMFYFIWTPVTIILMIVTFLSFYETLAFILMLCVDTFIYYFMVSSLVGYVELRPNTLFIKFGFILRKEIPYNKIREVIKETKAISYSYLSLKNALEHVLIKYNQFDDVIVSVVNNDELIMELEKRISNLEVE